MNTNPDQLTYTEPTPGLKYLTDSFVGEDQVRIETNQWTLRLTYDLQYTVAPKMDADFPDRLEGPHMRTSDKPSAVTPSHPPPDVLLRRRTLTRRVPRGRADGDEVLQPMQSPQPIPSGQSNGVCLGPTCCDHSNCKPPPDVGFLSRRFRENEDWIRARASAVASITHKRGGSKSLQKSV